MVYSDHKDSEYSPSAELPGIQIKYYSGDSIPKPSMLTALLRKKGRYPEIMDYR